MTLGSICPGCLETSVRYVLNQDTSPAPHDTERGGTDPRRRGVRAPFAVVRRYPAGVGVLLPWRCRRPGAAPLNRAGPPVLTDGSCASVPRARLPHPSLHRRPPKDQAAGPPATARPPQGRHGRLRSAVRRPDPTARPLMDSAPGDARPVGVVDQPGRCSATLPNSPAPPRGSPPRAPRLGPQADRKSDANRTPIDPTDPRGPPRQRAVSAASPRRVVGMTRYRLSVGVPGPSLMRDPAASTTSPIHDLP
jgi:hypothetical protein